MGQGERDRVLALLEQLAVLFNRLRDAERLEVPPIVREVLALTESGMGWLAGLDGSPDLGGGVTIERTRRHVLGTSRAASALLADDGPKVSRDVVMFDLTNAMAALVADRTKILGDEARDRRP